MATQERGPVEHQPGEHHRRQAHTAAHRKVNVAGNHQQGESAAQDEDGDRAAQQVDDAIGAEEMSASEKGDLVQFHQAEDHHNQRQHNVDIVALDVRSHRRGTFQLLPECFFLHGIHIIAPSNRFRIA